jgi:hypothetical protein
MFAVLEELKSKAPTTVLCKEDVIGWGWREAGQGMQMV